MMERMFFKSYEDVCEAMRSLASQNRPFRFESRELAPGYTFDAVPVRPEPQGILMYYVHDAEPAPGIEGSIRRPAGRPFHVDFDSFQDLTWEPIEVNDYDWKQHIK